MANTRTQFSKLVIKFIKRIPSGKVATYGQIARLAGKPHSSRGVGWLLHSCSKSDRLPWHRVLNSRGKISHPEESLNYVLQTKLLQREGIVLDNGRVDLKKYLWKKSTGRSVQRRSNLV